MRATEFIIESNQDELESQFEFNLDTDASRLEVYDMRGGPAGRIEFYNPNPDMPKQIGIDMIYVLPRYQRQGLGTAMFKYLTNRGFNILKPTELTPDGQEFFKKIKFKKQDVSEGGAETSWYIDDTDKITLQDILELTKHIKQINLPITDTLKSKLLHWDGDPEEIERINQVTVSNQFPILVMIDEQGKIEWILDGNHRLHKAIRSQAKTIPAKLIKPSDLNDKAKRIFHIKEQGVAEATGDEKFDTMMSTITAPKAVKAQSREDKVNELIRQYFWHKRRADLGSAKTDEYGHDKLVKKILNQLNKMGVDLSTFDPVKLRNIKSQVYEQGVSEDQSIDNITIQNTVDDSFRGGYHGTLIARTPEQQIGYLQYSMYQGMPKISMIYVVPEFRRHRIANRLLKALQELAPDEEIDWGYTTNDGSALKRSIDFIRKPNPEIIKKKQKLAGVRSKLAQLNHKLEQLQSTDIELARRYVKTVGDRWNKLNDLEYRLENELSVAKGEYSKLIPEDELEEGFKQTLANLGFAAAVGAGAVGGGAIKDKVSQFMNPPAATAQQTQQAPKAVQPAAPVAKKPVAPQITKINPITGSPLETKLILGAKQAGLKGVELAQFLAQCAHETLDYQRMIERGGKNYFNKYERKKILGNVKAGDGIKYKGRGYIQLTGRDNYMRAGRALGVDLINKPHLAADPDLAIKIALWYWNTRVKPDVTDFSNTTEVTKQINSGLKGLQQRHQNFVEYISQAQKTEPNPG